MNTIRIPKVRDIITARPDGMDFETYRMLRKRQRQMLHGWNEYVMNGATPMKVHRHGRLDGVLFRPQEWTNSRDCQVVIE